MDFHDVTDHAEQITAQEWSDTAPQADAAYGDLMAMRGFEWSSSVYGHSCVYDTDTYVGATDPADATPGSIRGDYALDISRNVIHAGDSDENALMEYSIYFDESELVSYKRIDEAWLYE